MKRQRHIALIFVFALAAGLALAVDQFDLSFYTLDGGGQTFSTGGGYSLGGTIGQPDAGLLTGGGFSLQGGFWVVPPGPSASLQSWMLYP